MKLSICVIVLASILFSACIRAQDDDTAVQKVTILLVTGGPAAPPKPKDDHNGATPGLVKAEETTTVAATVIGTESLGARMPHRRRIDYSQDHLVIVGLAADSTERTRQVILDPRLIRAEALFGETDLTSSRLYRESVEFTTPVGDAAVVRFQILKPRWNGVEWQFDVIAETPIE